jgi:hypothetical protein
MAEKLWWASPVVFNPRTLQPLAGAGGRTWGTPPVPMGFCEDDGFQADTALIQKISLIREANTAYGPAGGRP